jgi:hypothetical protein
MLYISGNRTAVSQLPVDAAMLDFLSPDRLVLRHAGAKGKHSPSALHILQRPRSAGGFGDIRARQV